MKKKRQPVVSVVAEQYSDGAKVIQITKRADTLVSIEETVAFLQETIDYIENFIRDNRLKKEEG